MAGLRNNESFPYLGWMENLSLELENNNYLIILSFSERKYLLSLVGVKDETVVGEIDHPGDGSTVGFEETGLVDDEQTGDALHNEDLCLERRFEEALAVSIVMIGAWEAIGADFVGGLPTGGVRAVAG